MMSLNLFYVRARKGLFDFPNIQQPQLLNLTIISVYNPRDPDNSLNIFIISTSLYTFIISTSY